MSTSDNCPIPIIISGIMGRMGKMIVQCLCNERTKNMFTIVGAIEKPDYPGIGKLLHELSPELGDDAVLTSDIDSIAVDNAVLIEFSSSKDAVVQHCRLAVKHGWGMVIGTTGLDEICMQEITRAGKHIPIICSPNMSIGVNLLFQLVQETTRLLGSSYDIEIIDVHHRMKKDSPSGTAKALIELINHGIEESIGQSADIVYGHAPYTPTEQRKGNEIVVHSLRAGDVVGDHTIVFAGNGERVELIHRATSREAFARGSLKAAAFLYMKNPGIYTMAEVLGIHNC